MLHSATSTTSVAPASSNSRRFVIFVASLIAALTYQAYLHRFVQDDAFISFRYAIHLASGQGLVWNVGESPIEGFSNFLWTLLLSLCVKLGGDVVDASCLLGLTCYAVTLACVSTAVVRISHSKVWAAAAVLVLGLNYSFRAYATGGLETSLQSLLFAASAYALVRVSDAPSRSCNLWLLSGLLGAAVATRLDAALIALPFWCTAWMIATSKNAAPLSHVRSMIALFVPAAVILSALLLFKLAYFGDVFPNTFYVKGTTSNAIRSRGMHYIWAFFREYWLLPIVLTAVATLRRKDLSWTPRSAIGLGLLLWFGYIMNVGGDFMEFRMLVPTLPLLACFCAYAAPFDWRLSWIFAVLAALTIWASYKFEQHYAYSYWIEGVEDVETIHSLTLHVDEPVQDWRGVGLALREQFGGQPITIAVEAAGAIPYYSGLRTIDLYGLNDRWIAQHGRQQRDRPGHQRTAPISYLTKQRVNLIVHPWTSDDPERLITQYGLHEIQRYVAIENLDELPSGAEIIEIPVNETRALRILYLTRHPVIDHKIKRLGWREFRPVQR